MILPNKNTIFEKISLYPRNKFKAKSHHMLRPPVNMIFLRKHEEGGKELTFNTFITVDYRNGEAVGG
jgi:hypothetical protein